VDLPPQVSGPFEVFVNGVPQEQGRDYTVVGRSLLFSHDLVAPRRDTPKSLFRTLFYGRYKPEHVVDVAFQAGGESRLISGLPIAGVQTRE
jgi:hypothetical protein